MIGLLLCLAAQTPDTAKPYTLAPTTVSVTRAELPLTKILVDGIPQTLPDGQGQLTNVELGEVDRIEVLRGSASALFGNASGGVISIWTNPHAVAQVREEARFAAAGSTSDPGGGEPGTSGNPRRGFASAGGAGGQRAADGVAARL